MPFAACSNCQTSLAPVSGLQCNYATRCADGPTYNVQDVFSSSCLTPAFADQNSSGVYHITGADGSVMDCAGTYECCAGTIKPDACYILSSPFPMSPPFSSRRWC